MKKVKHLFLKNFSAILIAVLALFGFTSCDRMRGGLDMYGTPTANFKVKGAVVSAVDKEPIEGIQVKLIKKQIVDGEERILFQSESVTTDAKGSFEFTEIPQTTFEAHFSDIDGAENGLFENKAIVIDHKKAVIVQGKLTKTLNVELTPKREDIDEE
jgi:putative lipoprotein (rSAM/lipoprotein system)